MNRGERIRRAYLQIFAVLEKNNISPADAIFILSRISYVIHEQLFKPEVGSPEPSASKQRRKDQKKSDFGTEKKEDINTMFR